MIVVIAIMTSLSAALFFNFRASSTNQTARNQASSVIISDIRRAQTLALAGSRYSGQLTCGYGVHYVSANSYSLFVITDSNADNTCTGELTGYTSGASIMETRTLPTSSIVIRQAFDDIYFLSPFAKAYIGQSAVSNVSTQIILQPEGQVDCVSNPCSTISVYTSGRIDTSNTY